MNISNFRLKLILVGLPGFLLFAIIIAKGGVDGSLACLFAPITLVSMFLIAVGIMGWVAFDLFGFPIPPTMEWMNGPKK